MKSEIKVLRTLLENHAPDYIKLVSYYLTDKHLLEYLDNNEDVMHILDEEFLKKDKSYIFDVSTQLGNSIIEYYNK